jgi:hypothetical protein
MPPTEWVDFRNEKHDCRENASEDKDGSATPLLAPALYIKLNLGK